jgi:hypothetical protein
LKEHLTQGCRQHEEEVAKKTSWLLKMQNTEEYHKEENEE